MAFVKGTYASDLLDTRDGITSGVDVIYGYGGDDTIYAYGGNDHILGGYGADYIDGGNDIDTAAYVDSGTGVLVSLGSGAGFNGTADGDTLFSIENLSGSNHNDLLIGDDGANLLAGGQGRDSLKGGGGADHLVAGEGDDWLYGDAGADILDGGLGYDYMSGGTGDDVYFAQSIDTLVEVAGEGYDVVFAYDYAYTLPANLEALSLAATGARGVYGTGNALANTIYGNEFSNTLDGGAGADNINGLGGNDTFIFRAGEANGDTLYDFQGNGLGAGDVVYFVGYGSLAQGATFHQLDATRWEISSADGSIHDIVTFAGAPAIDATDFSFY